MAVWNQISYKELEYTRIDAEFYQPKYTQELKQWEKVSGKFEVLKLKNVITKPVRTGHTPKNRVIKKGDSLVPFIKTNTLREGSIVYQDVEYLPERCLSGNDYIEDEAVIVTIIGATKEIVGRVAIKEKINPESTTNQNVGIINFKSNIDPYYGMIYLQSKLGRDQLWRHSRQTEQVNLNCREVERVLFPNVDFDIQKSIGNDVRLSFQLQKQSQDLYKQATELLDKELGLDTIEFEKPRSYRASFSEVILNNRADSEYYQVHFRQIEEHLKTLHTIALGTLCSFIKGYEVGTKLYTEEGPTFIRVSNFTKNGFSFGDSDKHISNTTYNFFKAFKPNIGDILLTKDGTVGMCYVVDEEVEGIISSGIVNLTLLNESIPKEYLALVINSKICQMQANRDCSGALISHWKPQDIRKTKIPLLENAKMQKLNDLVVKAKSALKQSKKLLEQAKQRVEGLIENATGTQSE